MTEGAEHGTAARIVCVCAALWLLHSDGLDKWWEAGPALGGGVERCRPEPLKRRGLQINVHRIGIIDLQLDYI